MSDSEIAILLSYLDEVGTGKIRQALEWSNRYRVTTNSEGADHRQVAALVRLYELVNPFSSTIGEILCVESSADASELSSWLQDEYEFPADDIYAMLTCWMVSGARERAFSAADINRKYEVMQEAALKGDLDLIQWLLKQYVEVDFRDSCERTALHVAAEGGHGDLVKFLLEKGASTFCLDTQGQTPFYKALDRGHFETADLLVPCLLLNRKRDFLLGAVEEGSLRKVRYLLKYVTASDPHFQSSLRLAASNGYVAIVEEFLVHCYLSDSSLNAKDLNGKTPLSLASKNGHSNVVEKLLAAGADIDEETLGTISKINNKNVLKVFKKLEGNFGESGINSWPSCSYDP